MNDAAPPHKTLYRWEKRQSALDKPAKPTKHGKKMHGYPEKKASFFGFNSDDITAWLRQVENASSNAVDSVFPRSSGRQTGKQLVSQAAAYAKTTDNTYTGAVHIFSIAAL